MCLQYRCQEDEDLEDRHYLCPKRGYLLQDPFRDHHFHLTPVDRGFLTDEEILKIANKELTIPRLALVRDLFLFSCFTGLAYIDVATSEENTSSL